MGHIQTETPYYQPNPAAPAPFTSAQSCAADPSFDTCTTDAGKAFWRLRVAGSTNITLHGVCLYSFFQDYYQDCLDTEDCQKRILEVAGSYNVVMYNIFTVATTEVAVGIDKTVVYRNSSQSRFTTEVSVWLPIPGQGNVDIIYVGTEIWSSPTVTCSPPCILVLPTMSLSTTTTINPVPYTTSIEYGNTGPTTNSNGQVITTFFTTITTITVTIPPITTTAIPYSNVNVTGTQTNGEFTASPSVSLPPICVTLPDGNGGTTTRSIQLPPWPDVTGGPPDNWGNPPDPFHTAPNTTGSGTYYTFYPTTVNCHWRMALDSTSGNLPAWPSAIHPMVDATRCQGNITALAADYHWTGQPAYLPG
ncbi:hypothetical protein F4823DRAFT_426005 [Ustulina deusta]|nr:hypothetical protein F4823DRAFT_426005 [Ustulina deusta]